METQRLKKKIFHKETFRVLSEMRFFKKIDKNSKTASKFPIFITIWKFHSNYNFFSTENLFVWGLRRLPRRKTGCKFFKKYIWDFKLKIWKFPFSNLLQKTKTLLVNFIFSMKFSKNQRLNRQNMIISIISLKIQNSNTTKKSPEVMKPSERTTAPHPSTPTNALESCWRKNNF